MAPLGQTIMHCPHAMQPKAPPAPSVVAEISPFTPSINTPAEHTFRQALQFEHIA
jgi:hypothetical protein